MRVRDVSATLRKVSALRALCLRLPHLPATAEREHLRRFDALVVAPRTATESDLEALAAGWRLWWRAGQHRRLLTMAESLPEGIVARDRRLQTVLEGARAVAGAGSSAR